MTSSNVLGAFLQDVIGRDEVLTPTSGKLRTIHARIAKEVEDAKSELHSTVQQQWPTLKRQYNTTIDLSDRLTAISGEVVRLEGELDGDDTALRPRLQASFKSHAKLAKRHKDSEALVHLLRSLKSLQDANAVVDGMLNQGRLDEVVPALQTCERLITVEIEDWKKDCQPFRTMKEHYEHSRNIAKERLEEALDRCIAFSPDKLCLSKSTIGLATSASSTLSMQAIIQALSATSSLEQHLQRIAKNILQSFVRPVLVDGTSSLSQTYDIEGRQILELQPQPSPDLKLSIDSLTVLLQALRSTIASPEAQPEHRKMLLSFIIPPVQQLIVDNILVRSLPHTADKAALDAFQEVCKTVSHFESSVLSTSDDPFEPILQDWVQNAGMHWSNAIIQRCFASLRAEIATSEYWNKTESVEWLDDPADEEDKVKWERWLSESVTAPTLSQPQASSSKLQAQTAQPVVLTSSHFQREPDERAEEEEDVAWEFDEDTEAPDQEAGHDKDITQAATAPAQPVKLVPDSPRSDADDAWGFDEDEAVEEDTEAASSTTSPRRTNGHKKNSLSTSSTRSKSSQKSTRSSKGKSAQSHNDEQDDEEDAEGGWSFDADAAEDEEASAPLPPSSSTTSAGTTPSQQSGHSHSRNSSIEDAWGWSRNPDPDEDKPIGRPTKVIVSKKLGARGRTGSPAPNRTVDAEVISDNSRSATPLAKTHNEAETSTPVQIAPDAMPIPPGVEAPTELKKVKTSLLVSSRAKRVCEVALELLEAAVAVSSASHSAVDLTTTSIRLFTAYSDLFDLYRAIMPVAHAGLISTVPSIGMQFSNDCFYVARTATDLTTERLEKGKFRQEEKIQLRRPIESLRLHGQAVLEEQIDLQRVPLMETLDEADGFRNTDDPKAFGQCQRCVRQIVHMLTSIAHAWKPVLLKRVYFESLGILVNAVLLRVLVEIENQEDISEESSHRLNDLCKMLHELESLFMDGEESAVAIHVPVWFKFKFLSELLEASMADIMYLFNEGHLVDFSSTELSKLVRALFADSQMRQRNLETIARGR